MVANKNFPIASPLEGILVRESEDFNNQEIELDQVFLIFHKKIITLTPNDETDEIDIKCLNGTLPEAEALVEGCTDRRIHSPWYSNFIGEKLQTVWVCENAQGYRDQIIFAFGTLHPNLIFLCEGSAISVFHSQPIYRETASIPQRSESLSVLR